MSEDDGQDGITERVAAILAADAVGYSRLMADDEKATIAALDRARAVFAEHVEGNHGRVVDTAGDSVLAVFETTNGAVRASVAIQEGLAALNQGVPEARRMRFRIGIHLGDIHEKADGTVYGDGVNVAARLEALSEPGGITVSSSVHDSIRDRLDVGFAFLGEHEGKNLKTPVKAYRVLPEGEAPGKPRFPLMGVIAAAIAAIVVVAGAVWWQVLEPERLQMVTADGTPTDDPILAMPTGPAIAVLPFENLSENTGTDTFADGITDDIITRLSRFDGVRVIARNSTFQYKGQHVDVREVGQVLGAQYVLEGSIRKSANEVRVTAQLLETAGGTHVWAQEYDRPAEVAVLFETQDELTGAVAAAIASTGGALFRDQLSNIIHRPPESMDSYECVLLAHKYTRVLGPELHLEARDCLEETVEREPGYAEAWAFLAAMYNDEMFGMNPRAGGSDGVTRAKAAAERALSINSTNLRATKWLAIARYWTGDYEAQLDASRRALEQNPNDALLLMDLGAFLWHAGYTEQGYAMTEKAIALTPNPPRWYLSHQSNEHYRIGDYRESLKWALAGEDPDNFFAYGFIVRAYGQLGMADEARAKIDKLLEAYPSFREDIDDILDPWARGIPGEQQHWREGFEKAGLFDEPEPPSRPVIAVLPFDNLSGDPEQEYFADGITEDIITRLAQFPDILVLGRNTTFQFKGEAVDVKEIGARLEADYIIEGSIRRAGETVRVTAQLLDTESGGHIWAETYDRALDPANLFAMQDEITEAVASRIGDAHGAIARVEYRRSARNAPKSLSSYNCVLRYFEYSRLVTADTHREALDCLKKVIEDEPDYGEAMAFLGDVYVDEVALGINYSQESSLLKGFDMIERGVALDPGSGRARGRLARALYLIGKPMRAIREAEEALRLAPNNSDVITSVTDVFANTGAYERAEEMINRVTILNPNFPVWLHWKMAIVNMGRGEYADAIARLELSQMGWYHWTHAYIAAAHCKSGNIEQGQKALAEALQIQPDLAEVYWADMYLWLMSPKVRPTVDAVGAGLEACGWDVPPDPGPEAFAAPQ